MSQILLDVVSILGAWSAMVALCFRSSTQRHRMGLREQSHWQRRYFLAAAIAMLSVSLGAAIASNGVSFGIVLWLCQASVLGIALICWLPYSASSVARSGAVSAMGASLLILVVSWL